MMLWWLGQLGGKLLVDGKERASGRRGEAVIIAKHPQAWLAARTLLRQSQ